MNKVTIVCQSVSKSFANGSRIIEVLHSINFTAYERELVILMGPSGSGKTTLLAIIAGIMKPTSGSCLVLDKNMYSLSEKELTYFRGRAIGFLFQKFMLVPTLDALENAAIPLLCQGMSAQEAYSKAKDLLVSLGLEQQVYSMPEQLSGGEQQRVAIARAMIHNPAVLLCDEPTSFLDGERGKQIMILLKKIQEQHNTTVIVVTHDERIVSFADRVVRIEDGILKDDHEREAQLPVPRLS